MDKIRGLYEEHKRGNNLMDYDDLLVNTIRLLEEHEHVRRDVSTQWQHILVDEYQDTNKLQARIVRLLAYVHDNVMVVGDDSQSIYSFRGADFTNIMEFPKGFQNTRVIRLEENYRSTAPILTVTNSIIERAVDGYPKRLFTRKAGGPLPLSARCSTEREQSRFVVQCVKELHDHGYLLKRSGCVVPRWVPLIRSRRRTYAQQHTLRKIWRVQVSGKHAYKGCPRSSQGSQQPQRSFGLDSNSEAASRRWSQDGNEAGTADCGRRDFPETVSPALRGHEYGQTFKRSRISLKN